MQRQRAEIFRANIICKEQGSDWEMLPAFQIQAASNVMWLFYQTDLFLLTCEGLVIWVRLSD